jgi:prefoldin subunit 5
MPNNDMPEVKNDQVKPVPKPVENTANKDVAKAATAKSGSSDATATHSDGHTEGQKKATGDKSKPSSSGDVAGAARADSGEKQKNAMGNESTSHADNNQSNVAADKNTHTATDGMEKIGKSDQSAIRSNKKSTDGDVAKAAKDKTKRPDDQNKSQKESNTINPKDRQSTDHVDPVAKIEKTAASLTKQMETLKKLKSQYGEFIADTLKTADTDFEKIKSTSETVDNVAAVATVLVNVGSAARKGAEAMKLTGDALIKANKELLTATKDLALDPIKGVAKDKLAKTVDSVLGDGVVSKSIQDLLKIDKPSTWTQMVTGNIEDAHKEVTGKLSRDLFETNDKYDQKIYNIQQQILELNMRRDEINKSGNQ